MKGLEKLSYSRLATVLAQDGHIPAEVLTEALRESNERGASLPEILIRDGFASEWDLVRLVSQEFSLPIFNPSMYMIDKEVFKKLPPEMIRKTLVIPVDQFGGILSLAMPILTPFSVLEEISAKSKLEVFPYIALLSEVKKMVAEKFPDAPPTAPVGMEDGWEKLFDEADQQVKKESTPGS